MDAAEIIAIIILIIAILILVYYYLQANPNSIQKLRGYVPVNLDAQMNNMVRNGNSPVESDDIEKNDDNGVSKKIKVKLNDIDMSSFNTDAFSKKIDAFLNQKSDELIKEWSLVTTNDLDNLEQKFSKTTKSVDDLEEQFNSFKKTSKKFRKTTKSRLDEIDKRLDDLENK